MVNPKLSIILPYYKKLREFSVAASINAPYFAKSDCEVVLVLDEPSQERQVLDSVRKLDHVKWLVIVNDNEHTWRPPCCAQNVGIRHASGDFILLADPESVFATDAVSLALDNLQRYVDAFLVGCVTFATFARMKQAAGMDLETIFHTVQRKLSIPLFYGSLCVRRTDLIAVNGYDESLKKWGGDDDNLRLRLMMNGLKMQPIPEMKLLHLSYEARLQGQASRHVVQHTQQEKRRIRNPRSAVANRSGWGQDFDRIALDWKN